MQRGAIILCGGRSMRMGVDKAMLPFGTESMLARVTRIVSEVVDRDNVVVVAAPEQQLILPVRAMLARDVAEYQGPLAGLATGLRTFQKTQRQIDAVFCTGCDCPLLLPAFIESMFSLLNDCDAAVPIEGGNRYPLAAVYRPRVLSAIDKLLNLGQFKAQDLFNEIHALSVPVDNLRSSDPQLHSLRNVNTQADLVEALKVAGLATSGTIAQSTEG